MGKKAELTTVQLTLAINDLIDNMQDTFKKILHQDNQHLHHAVNDLLEAWLEFTRRALPDDRLLAHAQMVYWQDYLLLCKDLTQRLSDHAASTLSGGAEGSRETILLGFLDKFSFLMTQHVQVVIQSIFPPDHPENSKKIAFYTRQFVEAFAQLKMDKTQSEALYARLTSGEESP